MSVKESPDYRLDPKNFAAAIEAAAEPYDPNITYLVGNTVGHEVQPQPKSKVSCLSIINQIVSGKVARPAPNLDITKSKLFKDREARLKTAAEAALRVGKEVII